MKAIAIFLMLAMIGTPIATAHDIQSGVRDSTSPIPIFSNFTADFSQIQHGTYDSQILLVPAIDGAPIPIVVQEYDLFAPGEKKVQYGESKDEIQWEEDLNIWTYKGFLLNDANSRVSLTFDDAGVMGNIRFSTGSISFEPVHPNQLMDENRTSEHRVIFRGSATDGGSEGGLTYETIPCASIGIYLNAVNYDCGNVQDTGLPTTVTTLMQSHQYLYIKPFADKRHTDAHGSSAGNTRITDAFNQQHDVYDDQLEIHQSLLSIFRRTSNYSNDSNCGDHLEDFSNFHGTYSSASANQLFTGKNISCNGVAYINVAGMKADSLDSVVEDVDHSNWDYYDPDEDDDRGLVSAHEIAHNWGEPDHPQDKRKWYCSCYNIMASGKDHDHRVFWFTDNTVTRITTAMTVTP